MKKIKILVVEDNLRSQQLIVHLLTTYCPNIEIVGVAETIDQAISFIKVVELHALFLDIHLQDRVSFDLFNEVDCTDFEIVFTTAFDQYAAKAFKYQAVDYIVKPFDIDDLVIAVERLETRIEQKRLFNGQDYWKGDNRKKVKHITIESLTKTNIINLDDIIYCQSEGRYTLLSLKNNQKIVASINLGKIEEMLDDYRFFRIHHSYIVNINYVLEITKTESVSCLMPENILLPVASRRRTSLKAHLQSYL